MKVTLRAHIYIVNKRRWMTLMALLCAFGCASGTGNVSSASKEELKVTALDVSGRGKPDTWRTTRPSGDGKGEILVREEVDLNLDGKVDLTKSYENSKISKIIMDLDFDGRPDLTEFYENGEKVRDEGSRGFSGKVDTWRYFDKGVLQRVERDTNGDGKPDHWMYYEKGALKRTGIDLDFDGVVDTWQE